MKKYLNKNILLSAGLFVALISALFVSRGMFVAFLMLFLLMAGTFWFLNRKNKLSKKLAILLCIAFLVHFSILIFIHYTEFRPVGGGADYEGYQRVAEIVSSQFLQGNFNVETAHFGHDFPIVIGVIYTIFGSDALVGKFFVLWLFVLTVLFSYLIVLELGGGEKRAFLIGLFITLYPSYAYFGSLLLKDNLVIPLIMMGILLILKLIRNFSWAYFIILFILSSAISYLRFYVGYALIFAFILSWFLLLKKPYKENFWLGFTLTLILVCFAPYFAREGFFGFNSYKAFLTPEKITLYREVTYNPNPDSEKLNLIPVGDEKEKELFKNLFPENKVLSGQNDFVAPSEEFSGNASSFVIETGFSHGPLVFFKNSLLSFAYALLGPFAWNLKYRHQLVSLAETIPWHLFIIAFVYFLIGFIRKERFKALIEFLRKTAPLWTFTIFALGALSLFINNYGIILRVRIPMIICLVIMMSLIIDKKYRLQN